MVNPNFKIGYDKYPKPSSNNGRSIPQIDYDSDDRMPWEDPYEEVEDDFDGVDLRLDEIYDYLKAINNIQCM